MRKSIGYGAYGQMDTPMTTPQTKSPLDALTSFVGTVASAGSQAYTAKQWADLNLERAKQGLPPLAPPANMSPAQEGAYAVPQSSGPGMGTILLILVALGVIGFVFLKRKPKAARRK